MDIVITTGRPKFNDMPVDVLVVGELSEIAGYKQHSAGFRVKVTDQIYHRFYEYKDNFLIFNIENHAERTIIGQKLLKYMETTNSDRKLILFHSDLEEVIDAIE